MSNLPVAVTMPPSRTTPVAVTLKSPTGISAVWPGNAPIAVTLRQPTGISSVVADSKPVAVTLVTGGPRGPAGASGVATAQIFNVPVASSNWRITHNLGRVPVIMIYDEAGNHRPFVPMTVDDFTATLSPNPPLAGKAVVL